jgi:hypothetical protein
MSTTRLTPVFGCHATAGVLFISVNSESTFLTIRLSGLANRHATARRAALTSSERTVVQPAVRFGPIAKLWDIVN